MTNPKTGIFITTAIRNLFSPWNRWEIYHLSLSSNHSLDKKCPLEIFQRGECRIQLSLMGKCPLKRTVLLRGVGGILIPTSREKKSKSRNPGGGKRAYPEFPKNLDCQLVQNRHNTHTIKLLLTELYTVTIGCLVLIINFNFSVWYFRNFPFYCDKLFDFRSWPFRADSTVWIYTLRLIDYARKLIVNN